MTQLLLVHTIENLVGVRKLQYIQFTMNNNDKAMNLLDLGTQLSLNAIWKELVNESIKNSTFTGKTINHDDDDWDIITSTSFTEPVWGVVVNK